jgi:peptidoglycan/LPS O-acetylase OafA/YrhL
MGILVLKCIVIPVVGEVNRLGIGNVWILWSIDIGSAVVFTCLAATVSYRWIEVPSVKLGRIVSSWMKRPGERTPELQSPAN